MSLSAPSRSHYLAAVTLLGQLDPKEYDWFQLSVILEGDSSLSYAFYVLNDGMDSSIEYNRIVSKFLMDPSRAGSLWVNSSTYANLARHILEFLRDK
jgi:hypothetical protein